MGDNSMGNRQVQWVALGGKGAVGTEQTKGSREGSCRLSQESTRPLGTKHEAKLSILNFSCDCHKPENNFHPNQL